MTSKDTIYVYINQNIIAEIKSAAYYTTCISSKDTAELAKPEN